MLGLVFVRSDLGRGDAARGRTNQRLLSGLGKSARNYLVGLPVYTSHATSIPRHLGLPSNPDDQHRVQRASADLGAVGLPLARLDYPDAVLAWNTISVAAFLASLVIVAVVLPVPRTLFLPTLALLPFCHPLYGNFYHGTVHLVLVLLVTAIWALERSDRSSTAGLLLGAAAAIKLFPAYLTSITWPKVESGHCCSPLFRSWP